MRTELNALQVAIRKTKRFLRQRLQIDRQRVPPGRIQLQRDAGLEISGVHLVLVLGQGRNEGPQREAGRTARGPVVGDLDVDQEGMVGPDADLEVAEATHQLGVVVAGPGEGEVRGGRDNSGDMDRALLDDVVRVEGDVAAGQGAALRGVGWWPLVVGKKVGGAGGGGGGPRGGEKGNFRGFEIWGLRTCSALNLRKMLT